MYYIMFVTYLSGYALMKSSAHTRNWLVEPKTLLGNHMYIGSVYTYISVLFYYTCSYKRVKSLA